ncbi:MAG: kinase [Clostridiales bacterium]|jgi:D-glycero-alpha-D-manno-heptose-7-phosphate kinase|nr:kinase [Clostridiales bacterium]
MVIVKTPFRVSFFGGGTDYRTYFEEYGGSVLSAAINKNSYVTLRALPPFFSYRNKFTYSKIECFDKPDESNHPLVREAMKHLAADRIQINYDADLPARSGLGSSSSFAVGLLNAMHHFRGEDLSPMELAHEAIYLERKLCGEAGGEQDQVAAAVGGINRIDFSADGISVTPITFRKGDKEKLESRLLLAFTGFTHYAGEISKEQQGNIGKSLSNLHEMKNLVGEAQGLLNSGKINEFGRLLDYTWRLKRSLSGAITTEYIDRLYETAIDAGALGGKLLGAGGGGFMLFFADPDKHAAIKKRLESLCFVDFSLGADGTKIIYSDGERQSPGF